MTRLLERKYVYDVAQRILHWWIAIATLFLATSGLIASNMDPGSSQAYLWDLHISAGKVLLVGCVGRIIWGLIGPHHARFKALFFPKAWVQSLKDRKMLSADGDFGHHEQASLSYVGFYALVMVMIVTGFALAAMIHGEGPLAGLLLDHFKFLPITHQVHEYAWWAIGFFVVTHVGALIFHEHHDKIPLAQSMISGFQYRTNRKETKK